jgi:hypothetical protein
MIAANELLGHILLGANTDKQTVRKLTAYIHQSQYEAVWQLLWGVCWYLVFHGQVMERIRQVLTVV